MCLLTSRQKRVKIIESNRYLTINYILIVIVISFGHVDFQYLGN